MDTVERLSKSLNYDLLVNAGFKYNLKHIRLLKDKPIGFLEKKGKRLYLNSCNIGVNNSASLKFDKNTIYRILHSKKLPVPATVLIKKEFKIEEIKKKIDSIQSPWVIKPIRGSMGNGITVKVSKLEEVMKALEIARKFDSQVQVEEYIVGDNYRIYLFEGEVIDVVKRIPAYLIGNGKDTINILVRAKNKIRKNIGMPEIRIDDELIRFIKILGYDLNTVPENNKRIELRLNCSMCAGGETERIPIKDIHVDNIAAFVETAYLLGLNLAGIDFITPDIKKSYKKIKAAINEVNKAPMIDVHYFADCQMDNSVAERIIKKYFDL